MNQEGHDRREVRQVVFPNQGTGELTERFSTAGNLEGHPLGQGDLPDAVAVRLPTSEGYAAEKSRLAQAAGAAIDHAMAIAAGVGVGEFQPLIEAIRARREGDDDVAVHRSHGTAHGDLGAVHRPEGRFAGARRVIAAGRTHVERPFRSRAYLHEQAEE